MKNMMKKGLAWAAYGVAGACLWLGIAHANLIKDSVPWWIFHGRGIESTSTNCYIQVGDSGTITAGNATLSNLTITGTVPAVNPVTSSITTGSIAQATLGTATVTRATISVLVTGTVPFTVSVDTVTNAAGAAINVLKLTP